MLGVNSLSQAAAEYAVGIADRELATRRELVSGQRAILAQELPRLGIEAAPSEANFVWMRIPHLSGADLAARLERERVLVAPGGPLGADDHVRAAIRGPRETDLFLLALRRSLGNDEQSNGR